MNTSIESFISLNSVVTQGVLTIRVKGRCVIEVSRIRVRLVRCYFVAGASETSCFGCPMSTFHDRCKGSEPCYFEVQISWRVQHFGYIWW